MNIEISLSEKLKVRESLSAFVLSMRDSFGSIDNFNTKSFFLKNVFQNVVLIIAHHISKQSFYTTDTRGALKQDIKDILNEWIDRVLDNQGTHLESRL